MTKSNIDELESVQQTPRVPISKLIKNSVPITGSLHLPKINKLQKV